MKRRNGWMILAALTAALALAGCGAAAPETRAADGETALVDAAVSQVLLDGQGSGGWYDGECAAEGHAILDVQEEDGQSVVYLIGSSCSFGFCSGNFVSVSGMGATPLRMTFDRAADGSLTFAEQWWPMDGAYYADSIRETFPAALQADALDAQSRWPELWAQERSYAEAYLEELGRPEAPVGSWGDFSFPLATGEGMSVAASNELLGRAELSDYPYYLGTEERMVDGVRWVYATAWEPDGDGRGTATYTRYRYDDGEILQQLVYLVDGETVTPQQ